MTKWIILTAIWKDQKFISIPIEISDQNPDQSAQTVFDITQEGTDALTMFKMPISNTSYIIFSRKQLDETVIIAQVLDKKPTVHKKSKKDNI